MALQRLTISGYGQIELNQVAWPRDGRIEAQCALSTADFSTSTGCENGMLLAIDSVNSIIKKPTAATQPMGIVYSTEHLYLAADDVNALKDYYMVPGGVLPRLGYLAVGDKFTLNAVCYSDADYPTESLFLAAVEGVQSTALYGTWSTAGVIEVVNTAPTVGPKFEVLKKTTMPDGTVGIKFRVIG